jgi:hypothetical protein
MFRGHIFAGLPAPGSYTGSPHTVATMGPAVSLVPRVSSPNLRLLVLSSSLSGSANATSSPLPVVSLISSLGLHLLEQLGAAGLGTKPFDLAPRCMFVRQAGCPNSIV